MLRAHILNTLNKKVTTCTSEHTQFETTLNINNSNIPYSLSDEFLILLNVSFLVKAHRMYLIT